MNKRFAVWSVLHVKGSFLEPQKKHYELDCYVFRGEKS